MAWTEIEGRPGWFQCSECSRKFPLSAQDFAGPIRHGCNGRGLDCRHRGPVKRHELCQLCGDEGARRIPIFDCRLHGDECATSRTKSGSDFRCCLTCHDRTTKEA